jgi:hypothetical protein
VALQVFNEVNARKVGKYEWNVFSGLHTNWIFIAIIAITAVVQALIVEFGGDVFKTEPLSLVNWGYSIAIGAGSLIVGAILRLIPIPDMWCCAIKGTAASHPFPLFNTVDPNSSLFFHRSLHACRRRGRGGRGQCQGYF